jgi:hypothetical protein
MEWWINAKTHTPVFHDSNTPFPGAPCRWTVLNSFHIVQPSEEVASGLTSGLFNRKFD